MTRPLTLKREALAELTADELTAVVGGTDTYLQKITDKLFHSYRCTQ